MTVTLDCKNQILWLGQCTYLEKILFDHQMADCKPTPTPIENQYLTAVTVDYQPDKQFCSRHQSAVGSLIYAMLGTRPDLAFAVSVCMFIVISEANTRLSITSGKAPHCIYVFTPPLFRQSYHIEHHKVYALLEVVTPP